MGEGELCGVGRVWELKLVKVAFQFKHWVYCCWTTFSQLTEWQVFGC